MELIIFVTVVAPIIFAAGWVLPMGAPASRRRYDSDGDG